MSYRRNRNTTSTAKPIEKTQTITVEQAAKTLDQWQMWAPFVNAYTGARQASVLYNGKVVCVQIGTFENPVFNPCGLSYWYNPERKFKKVLNAKDVQWAWAEQQQNSKSKEPGGKVQLQLTLHEHDKPGTQGFYAWQWINGVVQRIVDGFVNGTPDESRLDANGKPTIVQPVTDTTNVPDGADNKRKYYLDKMTLPFQQPQGQYPPSLKTKIRYVIRNDTLVFPNTKVVDGVTGSTVPAGSELDYITPRARGIWIVKIGPLQLRPKEINLSIDVVMATAIPPQRSIFSDVTYAPTGNDNGNEDDVDVEDGEINSRGVTFAEQ